MQQSRSPPTWSRSELFQRHTTINLQVSFLVLISGLGYDFWKILNIFAGNQVWQLLSSADLLNGIFERVPTEQQILPECRYYFNYFAQLGTVQSYANASFLSDAEIDDLEREIRQFENLIFERSEPRITPKCQLLLRHVVPFVRKYKFWGKASEQSIEHLHARFNNDLRRLSAIREKKALYLQLVETTCIHNYIFDRWIF